MLARPLVVVALLAGIAGADSKVTVRSIDGSHGASSDIERKHLQDVMRSTIDRLVARAPVTLPGNRNVDASILSLTSDVIGTTLVVTSVIQLVVSDEDGRITAVLGSESKSETRTTAASLPQLRDDAVVGSLEGMYGKVKERLHGKPAAPTPAAASSKPAR